MINFLKQMYLSTSTATAKYSFSDDKLVVNVTVVYSAGKVTLESI